MVSRGSPCVVKEIRPPVTFRTNLRSRPGFYPRDGSRTVERRRSAMRHTTPTKMQRIALERLQGRGLDGVALLHEALLTRGFLVDRDGDRLWLARGSDPLDGEVLRRIAEVVLVEGDPQHLAELRLAPDASLAETVTTLIHVEEGRGRMSYMNRHRKWAKYRKLKWGARVPAIGMDTGVALLVKALPMAHVCTCLSCDGDGESGAHVSLTTEWDAAWLDSVLEWLAPDTPGTWWEMVYVDDPCLAIWPLAGRFTDRDLGDMMDDIQRVARRFLDADQARLVGEKRWAVVEGFGTREPSFQEMRTASREVLGLPTLSRGVRKGVCAVADRHHPPRQAAVRCLFLPMCAPLVAVDVDGTPRTCLVDTGVPECFVTDGGKVRVEARGRHTGVPAHPASAILGQANLGELLGTAVDGVLGLNYLTETGRVTLDLANRLVRFGDAPLHDAVVVPMVKRAYGWTVQVALGDARPVEALLDLGSWTALATNPTMVADAPLVSRGWRLPTAGSSQWLPFDFCHGLPLVVGGVPLGPRAVATSARIPPAPFDLVVGIGTLAGHVIQVDFPRSVLRLQPQDATRVPAVIGPDLAGVGIQVHRRRDVWRVLNVLPSSPADGEAREGQSVAVTGCTPQGREAVNALWDALHPPAGSEVRLLLDGKEHTLVAAPLFAPTTT
jgi:hypothetical protein